jgi:hypothetical protein
VRRRRWHDSLVLDVRFHLCFRVNRRRDRGAELKREGAQGKGDVHSVGVGTADHWGSPWGMVGDPYGGGRKASRRALSPGRVTRPK